MLHKLGSITKSLQDEHTAIGDARTLSDSVLDGFLETAARLNVNASVVIHCEFENAIVNLQRDNISLLSRYETIAISKPMVQNNQIEVTIECNLHLHNGL